MFIQKTKMKKNKRATWLSWSPTALGFVGVLVAQSPAFASQEAALRMPRLESPEKLTVGPDNHFQVAVGSNEERIFFTRSSNLATRLYWRGLKGYQALGQVQPFVKAEFDTKDPAISFDNQRVAFTSFESQARGDVCVRDVDSANQTQQCAGEKVASEQPFWLNPQTVVFIRRPIGSSKAQLVSWNLQTQEKRVIIEDQILSAHADAQGRWIVYSSVADSRKNGSDELDRVLKVYRLRDGQIRSLRLSLPGLSGFPRFDQSGEFVYFAQFSNDTNADARIDGNDNGILFRFPSSKLEGDSETILAEQLTSAEQNCNYPAPGREFLYMTCAFEGTLDVYRIPKSGLVPLNWNEKNLLDAYRTSRSLAERTLMSNTLRYRFEQYRNQDTLEKILSQHFLGGEYQAALYYLDFIEANAPAVEKSGFAVLRNLLEVLQYRARERLDQISPEFISLLNEKRRLFESEKGPFKSFAELAIAYVDLSRRDNQKARERFLRVASNKQRSPLEQYAYFNLSRMLLTQNLLSLDEWYDVALKVAQSGILSDESKAFVSSLALAKIAETNKTPAQRLSKIQSLRSKAQPGSILETMFSSQEFILQSVAAQNEAAEDKAFQEFNKIASKTANQYYLNRALSVQAVLTLAEFDKTRVMGYVAANWLSTAKLSDTEYMLAREQYISVVLDKAYTFWAKPDARSASQVFYSSVRLTDDQESHLGFVSTLLQDNNRKLLDERYASLKQASFTAANLDFAKATVLLFDDLSRQERSSTELLEQAEKLLLSLKDDGTRPAGKHLLLGYIAHEKLLRKMKGFTFDQELSQSAHHQYMIALDLARKSPRLTAQVLQNLGMLHLQTGNFGLASGFLTARSKIAFENDAARGSFLWNYAQALYRNGEFPRAAEVSLQGLNLAKSRKLEGDMLFGWMERAAFHLSQAERYKEAADLYTQLLSQIEKRGDENTIKALLMQGWSLMKAGQVKPAANSFDKVAVLADKMKFRKASGLPGDAVNFQPERYRALAFGFLAQMNSTPTGRIPLRAQRMKIMSGWQGQVKAFALSEENWARFVLKDCASQATDFWLAKDFERSREQLEECLERAAKVVEDTGEPADEMMLETLRVTWMLASRLAEQKVRLSKSAIDSYMGLSRRALSKLDSVAGGSRPMANRWLKLRAEQTAVRSALLSVDQRDYMPKSDALGQLQQIGASDRLELLNAEERAVLSGHLERIKNSVNQLGQGK